ncbi:MAG: hypothetical protein AAFV19_13595 [Pseudomonadota bacterium]
MKLFPVPAIALAVVLGLNDCSSNMGKVLDDPNILPGTEFSISGGEFVLKDGSTGPLAEILFDDSVASGTDFQLGGTKYRTTGRGRGKHL